MNRTSPAGANRRWRRLALLLALGALPAAQAEDIDIFMASMTAGAAVQPNIMIMVDNSSNWSRAAQKWPDNGGKQGAAEIQALQNVLNSGNVPANMGFAGFTGSGSSIGGYVRFGIRDMREPANRTALDNILGHIKANVESSAEKVNDNGETAAMYEVYKYFNSQPVFRGGLASGNNPASNVDQGGNLGNPAGKKPTAFGQGLGTGFAIDPLDASRYAGPTVESCGRNYLIFVVNNANGRIPEGASSYEGVSAGSPLPLLPGVQDTSWTDEWARFLYQSGISVYILDAYNAQQNVAHSKVLQRAATVGGGKYFAVKNQEQIETAIKQIFAEINAVTSTFASASLPISATNRSQNLNQVFIGMFRPDGEAEPRWMGNLKRYQLIRTESGVDLGDQLAKPAVNLQTGFVTECSASYWSTDSGSYWADTYGNALTRSGCTVFPTVDGKTGSEWSDLPDGPVVEKGGVAEVLRKGNAPSETNTTPTWGVNRNIYTYAPAAAGKLEAVSTANTGWSSGLLAWVQGWDDATEVTVDGVTSRPYSDFTTVSATARTRPSIHGDVIHSRPLPVNYGDGKVTVYYGSNDGMVRAVDAETGRERWAFVAPEHFGRFQRLHDNAPLVNYPNVDPALNPLPRDYFFDGSMGLYQTADNSRVWIFLSQRRGGRMLYGFDVTNPEAPALKWRVGCPNMDNDTGCTPGFEKMGQTWSIPSVAFLKGHSETTPVVIVGGGYDRCEDANSPTPSCGAGRKGGAMFVIDADTGARVALLETPGGSVAADIALADTNGDGSVDFGYAATTSGDIWRADFSTEALEPAAPDTWGVRRVAYTDGDGRKFLYPPALLNVGSKMYLAVGSGDREHPLGTHYPYASPVTNRFYVVLDDLGVRASSDEPAIDMDTDAGMQNYTSEAAAVCGTPGVSPNSGLRGWFMDLPGRGEQTVTSALIAAGMVTFNTNRATPSSAQACRNPLGEARGYWVNLLNGSGGVGVGNASCGGDRSSVFVGGGLMPSPTLASVVIGKKVETVVIGATQRSGGSSSGIAPQQLKPAISSKRRTIYWRANGTD